MKNFGLMFLILWIFVILAKILGWTTLSWIWVLCPIWISLSGLAIISLLLSLFWSILGFILLIKTFEVKDDT